jgi:flagellar assembly factor FliW
VVTTDYSPDTAALIKDLNWNGADRDVEVYVVVNLGSGTPEEMTVNLMGPVLINPHRREAAQVVLHDSPFSCRHPVFP